MYDIIIIGAGIIGAMCARELAKYKLNICILEAQNDVACGTTKANSAIIHAGFDAKEDTLKAKLNVIGSNMMPEICHDLGVKYKNNGSLVVGFDDEDKKTIEQLYQRGIANGVKNLEIVDSIRLHELEPNVSKSAKWALYAPTGAITCPYELTIALVGNAMDNGVELQLNSTVIDIKKNNDLFELSTSTGTYSSRYVINAAGLYSDQIAKFIGDESFEITPRRGEYILLDKECGKTVSHTIFRCPSKMGKGILVTPTVDGNLLLGPTSVDIIDKDDLDTTACGFDTILSSVHSTVDNLNSRMAITSFSGLRAISSTHDFVINFNDGFINAAGICSPGLSAAPGIALYVVDLLKKNGVELALKKDYIKTRKSMSYFSDASLEEKNEIIKRDKSFGKIVCRCESVTEGEIIEAIRTNPKPTDLDGIKRRCRAQMGRCQGGFCMPSIALLLAKENNIKVEDVTKCGEGSNIIVSKTKEVL